MEISEFRTTQAQVDRLFVERWSPRAFSDQPMRQDQIDTLLEAARWSPSSFNRQPWLFLYETKDGPQRAKFEQSLAPPNREWAAGAPLLIAILVEKDENEGQWELSHGATFDTGSAWMSIALQARIMGLYAHAMGGVDREAAHELLNIPRDKYHVACIVAVGALGNAQDLPEQLREREQPSPRNPLSDVARRGAL